MAATSLDWDLYKSHPRGPEGAMRGKCPWAAVKLNNSRHTEMVKNSEAFAQRHKVPCPKFAMHFARLCALMQPHPTRW